VTSVIIKIVLELTTENLEFILNTKKQEFLCYVNFVHTDR